MNKFKITIACLSLTLALSACNVSLQEIFSGAANAGQIAEEVEVNNAALKTPRSIIVCRTKQCAPANLSMSREYIYNSLLHLLDNNNHKTALICQADPNSRTCTENYISMPIKVGVTPAYLYIDSVKISDVLVGKGNNSFNLVLNYNVTHGGQTPDCIPAKTLLYVKNVNNVIMEDSGYSCKMTTIGQTTIKTVFAIDYIDLDYGYIGGYYSIGASGPSYGGGTGYMIIRLPQNAYPLNPSLMAPKTSAKKNTPSYRQQSFAEEGMPESASSSTDSNVQIFPIKR